MYVNALQAEPLREVLAKLACRQIGKGKRGCAEYVAARVEASLIRKYGRKLLRCITYVVSSELALSDTVC